MLRRVGARHARTLVEQSLGGSAQAHSVQECLLPVSLSASLLADHHYQRRATSNSSPAAAATATATAQQTAADGASYKLDFTDPRVAYGGKTNAELLRAWVVFRLCGIPAFVQNSDKLLSTSRKILGDRITFFFVRHTFFNHFCAGEDKAQVKQRMERLKQSNVGGILDYAAEDVPPSGAEQGKSESKSTGTAPSPADTLEKEVVARQYDYSSESQSDTHAQSFLEAIKAAAHIRTSPAAPSYASVKLTALGNPVLLERTSSAINIVRGLFHEFDKSGDGFLDAKEFEVGYKRIFPRASAQEVQDVFQSLDPEGTGKIDYVEWSQRLRLEDMPPMAARILKCLQEEENPQDKDLRNALHSIILTREEVRLLDAMRARLSMLAKAASDHDVKLLVDAEHTFYQPAINHLALELLREYNHDPQRGAVVYNTYQAYLKQTRKHLADDLERAKRQGYVLGVKLVRGAYVKLERQRAQDLGYESPICDTIEDTHNNYNGCMQMMMDEVAQERAELMVASHNQRSVEIAAEEMGKRRLHPSNSPVAFGTLMGMSDHLSSVLGLAGFRAFKLVPYGKIEETIPYLLRRATENADVLKGAKLDLQLIQAELKRRLMSGELFLGMPVKSAAKQ